MTLVSGVRSLIRFFSKLPYYCPSVVKPRLNDSRYHENIQNYVERCPIRLYDIISEEFVTRDKLASHIATSLKNTRYVYEQVIGPAIGALFDTLHRAVTEADPPSISTDGAELLLDILLADEDRKWTLPLSDIIAREFTPNIPFKDHRRAESILRLLIILVFNLAAAPINAVVRNLGKYAILSHRWQAQGQEVTFGDMPDGIAPHSINERRGIRNSPAFVRRARGLGIALYGWIVCASTNQTVTKNMYRFPPCSSGTKARTFARYTWGPLPLRSHETPML